jgi:peptide/nickel transport system permease protein
MLSTSESDENITESNPNKAVSAERFRTALSAVRHNGGALIGATIVAIFAVTAIVVFIAGVIHVQITPFNPLKQDVGRPYLPPSLKYLMGTDNLGRDLFSRVVSATPNDFSVSLVVIGFSLCVGAFIGTYAAFYGGLLDEALMRVTDIFFAIPALVLAMAIGIALGPGIEHMTIALMIIWWPPYARLARGEALKIAHQNYIEAARLAGSGTPRIILGHALPNITMTLLVYASLDVGTVILVYAGLSYLGLAVRPPLPDWGEMVSSYQDYLLSEPWLPLFPGLVIAMGVIGFSLLGDGLRDALESI